MDEFEAEGLWAHCVRGALLLKERRSLTWSEGLIEEFSAMEGVEGIQ